MDARDIIIIGGGPAGSTAAWHLTRAGFRVALLDKAVFPRDKVCAGWITPSVIESLQLDIDDYRKCRVFQTINGFQISVLSGSGVEIQYPEAVSYGIRRFEFDDYLLRRSGAELSLGEAALSIRREEEYWIINEKWKTPLLIGAGGHHCPVSKFLRKERNDYETVVIAQEAEFAIKPEEEKEYQIQAQRPELYFCDDLRGYGWCFRKGNYLNIGMGREDRSGLSRHLADFILALKQRERIPSGVEFTFKGHSYLLNSHSFRPVVGEGILLIGDSAGLAYSESGEGIRPALESAFLAAETILKASGRYDRTALAPYETNIQSRFGNRSQKQERNLNWLKTTIGRNLMSKKWFVDHILLKRWFLHIGQPPLDIREKLAV